MICNYHINTKINNTKKQYMFKIRSINDLEFVIEDIKIVIIVWQEYNI